MAIYPFAFGSSDNLFFESNTITYSALFTGSDPSWIESRPGTRIVVRYNTFNFANTTCTEYWDIHGFQNLARRANWDDGRRGCCGNELTNASGYRWVDHRGSQGLFFNNIMTGANGGSINGWINSHYSRRFPVTRGRIWLRLTTPTFLTTQ